jgi:tetratricopeptide (TPR) repeat protein
MSIRVATAVSVVLSLALAGCETPHPELDPAFLKATAVEARVDVIERQNGAILELQRQLESAQNEQRSLKGQVEELQHTLASGERRERDLYRDLSDRLAALEVKVREVREAQATTQAQVVAPPPAAAVAASTGVAITDKDVYQSALEHLKAREYAVAEKAFQDFLLAYPQSSLADNAKYWLGESYYVEHRFTDALSTFQKLLKDHPDSRKVPDALLKVGYSFQELKRHREARETLARLIKAYPDAPATVEARERLKQIAGRH